MDVEVAFGTDSLASVDDLSVFRELAAARRLAPRVPASQLLRSATLCGARALGFGGEMGSIEAGKRASLIAVRLPASLTDVDDVEEYLVERHRRHPVDCYGSRCTAWRTLHAWRDDDA